MNNLELQLVTFEQAKALKELGFPQDIDTTKWYSGGRVLYSDKPLDYLPVSFVAPTLEIVAKWLRNEKYIHIDCEICEFDEWQLRFYLHNNEIGLYHILPTKFKKFDTYEQALSVGIDKAIEILKGK